MKSFSLVGRLTALVALVSVMALTFNALLFVSAMHDVGREVANKWAGQVHMITAVLRDAPASERVKAARAMSVGEVSVSQQDPPQAVKSTASAPTMPAGLRESLLLALGAGIAIVEAPGPGTVPYTYVSVTIDHERWWIGSPTPGPSTTQRIAAPLGALCLVALSAALTLFLGLRIITRPMSRLANDMLSRSGHLRPIEVPPRVSTELARIIGAFNALVMALRLAEQMRRQLLAGISHDLRIPLSRLQLRAELHGHGNLHEAMSQDIGAALNIVDQFMRHAQHPGHVTTRNEQAADLVLRQVVQQYQGLSHPVTLQQLDRTALCVDALPMQRLLGNLIDNALAHGRPPVVLSLLAVADGAELWVHDHGQGFTQTDLHSALQPHATSGIGGGTDGCTNGHFGLGLSIVEELTRRLGGELLIQPFDGQRFGIGVKLNDPSAECPPQPCH